jgi:2'-5' RNA ligase
MSGNTIRAFVALEIAEPIRRKIDREITAKLRKCGVRCSWVRPENIHLTLKFLGDTPSEAVAKITRDIGMVLEGIAPLELRLEGVGTFGGKSPKVVWAGLSGDTEALELITRVIDDVTFLHGFPREKRPFSPHLTVGRVRDPQNAGELVSKIGEIEIEPEDFIAERIIFMKSELTPQGSIYTPLHEYDLL